MVGSSSASWAPRKSPSPAIQQQKCACAASRQSSWHSQAWLLTEKGSSGCLYRIARRISDGLLACHGTSKVSHGTGTCKRPIATLNGSEILFQRRTHRQPMSDPWSSRDSSRMVRSPKDAVLPPLLFLRSWQQAEATECRVVEKTGSYTQTTRWEAPKASINLSDKARPVPAHQSIAQKAKHGPS